MTADSAALRAELLRRLVLGVQADHMEYRELRLLLRAQFDAVLRIDSSRLAVLAARIAAHVIRIDERRDERMQLLDRLGLHTPMSMASVVSLFPETVRPTVAALWADLEALVRDCKRQNTLNCRVLIEQQATMRQLLHGEVHTYAPA